MKTIGLIGGMSWESTAEYYRIINEAVKERLGGFHSAKIVMYSVDFKEIDRLLEREARRLGFTKVSDYLSATNLTEEKLRERLRPAVKKQIARLLVLDEVGKIEKIEINESEVDNQISEMVKSEEGDAEKMRQLLQLPQVKESIQQTLRRDKAVDWLVKVATSGN